MNNSTRPEEQPRDTVDDDTAKVRGRYSGTIPGLRRLVDTGDDAAANNRRIALPVGAIFPFALFFVTPLPVDEQDTKIKHEEVSENDSPTTDFRGLYGLLLYVASAINTFNDGIAGNPGR